MCQTLKKIQKVIFENRNHENNPEREATKKWQFLFGDSFRVEKSLKRVRRGNQAEFFPDFFVEMHENRSA